MAYVNPGAAMGHALEQWVAERDAAARVQQLEDLKLQQAQLELEAKKAEMTNAARDREVKDVQMAQAQLIPGDVPDADLMARSQRVGLPLQTKIAADGSGDQGPMPDGADPLGTERVYMGDPKFRMQQMQAEQARALAEQRGGQMADAAASGTDPQTIMAGVLRAGGTPAEAKSIVDALQNGQPVYRASADKRTIEEFKGGQWVPATNIQEKGHWLQEPQPVNVHVGAQPGSTDLDDATLAFMADRVLAGGDEPAFGSGTQGAIARQRFQTALAKAAAAQGISGEELVRRRMKQKAEAGAASALQKTFETTEAFSEKAVADLGNLNAVMSKIPDSNIPVVNWFTRGLARQTGDTDMSAFDTYRRSVATEFARIISSINGGVLTDSARHEVDILVNPNASVAQIQSSINALKAEAANRHAAYSDRLDDIYSRSVGKPKAPAETPEQRRARLLGP